MPKYTDTHLWKTSLAQRLSEEDVNHPLERLRSAFLKFRERSGQIAGEISRDLPEFTVHDITHLDALWEMADLIAGPDFNITPTEAFVLGGSFLIHDLGNGLAAYPEGIETLRRNQLWNDTITGLLKRELGRHPTSDELQSPSKEIEQEATGEVLRNLHAKHAERLALISWKDRQNDEEYHLIEDIDLRRVYGQIIGKIAHSHWWPVEKLASEFVAMLGAPAGYPRDWTVDPLKIACLLRVADASHLDTRRAPGFLRALRKPSEYSRQHWIFQEHLQQPRLESERLVYTSGHSFSIEEANAWWLCHDTLNMVDRELQQVDALFADTNGSRFAAKGVAGVDDPRRLVRWIPTESWIPVDTRIKVGNVASLVRSLGGEQLYGKNKTVPLRELIQNAADAVRARRIVELRSDNYGDIFIRIGRDGEGDWIEVEDNGVGMSPNVLTGPFLDFGSSFWGSSSMSIEFPGLIAKGFESTGKYGIGFFSTFIWGNRVRVITRGYREAQRDTQVLEFKGGLRERPILRKAQEHEYIRDGGTCVRVWLNDDPFSFHGIFNSFDTEKQNLEEICAWLCPSLDVNLHVQHDSENPKLVITGSDWVEISGLELLKRVRGHKELNTNRPKQRRKINRKDEGLEKERLSNIINSLAQNLRVVKDSSGAIIGRACISARNADMDYHINDRGVVTVGGFRTTDLTGISGILIGTSQNAARDIAVPVIDTRALAEWATDQADLVLNVYDDLKLLEDCAQIVRLCGGDTRNLSIAYGTSGWVSAEDINVWQDIPNEILLVQDASLSLGRMRFGEIKLYKHVLAVDMGWPGVLQNRLSAFHVQWPEFADSGLGFHSKSLEGAVIETLSKKWGKSLEDILAASSFSDDDEDVEREIGTANGQPIIERVDIIRKPV